MVRHAESPFSLENERTRGLSEKGHQDAQKVLEIMDKESIEVIFSSPYTRAVQTVDLLAKHLGIEVEKIEGLKEKVYGTESFGSEKDFMLFIKRSYLEPDFGLPEGESNNQVQRRGIAVFEKILEDHAGKSIVIGTHGNIMTIIMNYYDKRYDLNFLKQTSKPDIYKMVFAEKTKKCRAIMECG